MVAFFSLVIRTAAITLVRFGATQWLANLGASLFGYADRIIVNLFLGSEAAGLYSAATSIAIQLIPCRHSSRVLPPAISAAKALSQFSRIREIFIRATKLNGLMVLYNGADFFWTPILSNLLVGHRTPHNCGDAKDISICLWDVFIISGRFFSAIGIGFPVLNARWGIIGALFSLSIMAIFASRTGLEGTAGKYGLCTCTYDQFSTGQVLTI